MSDVDRVRRFNRFYTRIIGLLDEAFLGSGFSLAEVRVLFELAHTSGWTASALGEALSLDAGYLSRILTRFTKRGLIARVRSKEDARQSEIALTAKGRSAFAPLNQTSHDRIGAILAPLEKRRRTALVDAMASIKQALDTKAEITPLLIRRHEVGDVGWIVHRQAILYAKEYGWDGSYEGLNAEIAGTFLKKHDPARERCWVAERQGEIAGSVFLVRKSETVGQLRMLYVEPSARGLGLGGRLVDECIRFARAAGYRRLTLWTNDVLVSARRIYQAAGFTLSHQNKHRAFGKDLVEQVWDLPL